MLDSLGHIGALLAVLVSLATLISFFVARQKEANAKVKSLQAESVERGRHLQEVEQLKADLARAHEKIRGLEAVVHKGDVSMAEMKVEVKNILDTVQRIEGKIDEHIKLGAE